MEQQSNTPKPNKMIVDVIEISRDANEILINDRQGTEDWVPIKAPADIKWIKLGECDVTLSEGAITYARNTSARPVNTPKTSGFKKPYVPNQYAPKSKYPSYPSSPSSYPSYAPATSYKPKEDTETTESTRIGVTLSLTDLSWDGIWEYYNILSMAGKWIVATNHVYLEDTDSFNAAYFIREPRTADLTPYMSMQDSNQSRIKRLIKDKPELLKQLEQLAQLESSKEIPMETFREEDLI